MIIVIDKYFISPALAQIIMPLTKRGGRMG